MSNAVSQLLRKAATVREGSVDIDGQKVFVREVAVDVFTSYVMNQKVNRVKATADLLQACVLDQAGGVPALSAEDALAITNSSRICVELVGKIMELSGLQEGEEEKQPNAS